MTCSRLRARLTGALCAVVLLSTSSAEAQYFGRNKVHYKNFDFQVLKTEHFDIYYYPEGREGVELAARMAERWRTKLQRMLGHELSGRQPLILYASHVDFEQTNTIQGDIGEGTGGVTEPLRRRIILPMGGPLADTDHVVGHEIVHAFQFDVGNQTQQMAGESGIHRLPLWFIEGMAEYLSIGPVDPLTSMWMRDAARQEKLPTIAELNDRRYFPYRWGQALWAYVGGRFGDNVIGRMLQMGAATGDPEAAIEGVLGIDEKTLSADWHQAIRATYTPVLQSTTPPTEMGRLAIRGDDSGDLNVGPAISPDGRWISFLAERDLFSIDLFIANTETGTVVRRLTSTASSPHYSSIQFIASSGGWDAESRRLAIAAVAGGRPALAIFDAASGDRVREIKIPGVDEIFNPTWSPDGQSIAFTAMTRGVTDLFVIDLKTTAVRALTNDSYSELQPAWSPDGRQIAFATDRFSSRLDVLDIGNYRIGLIDPATGVITQAGGFNAGKNINPQWSPDSNTIYFIADRDGISNLARVPAAGGSPVLLTNVMTGISGITASSPALSLATRANVAAFTVYDAGKYDIYTRPLPDTAPVPPAPTPLAGAQLPPADRRASTVQALLDDPLFGLPARSTPIESTKYRPRLGIEAVGQPTIGVGANRFGAFVAGGLSAYFSDMLGNHTLATALQLNSSISSNFSPKDTAAQVTYFNQATRWNWGVLAGQVPYLSGGFQQGVGAIDGLTVVVDQTIILRQTERSAAGVAAYPFNRSQRVEFQAGVTQMSFEREIRTQAYLFDTGQRVYDTTETQRIAEPLTLGTSSGALVFDTSIFGATSPVGGSRYRLEASPTFGSITYTTVVADYRRYLAPAPFYTFAGRLMHYGRYGAGGQDERLFPLYLGYPTLVRGYDITTFSGTECAGDLASRCVSFDQLSGSRLLVGNLEFRVPLLRPFIGASPGMYGPIPIELAMFADGGIAWNQGQRPSVIGGDREGIASSGVSIRASLLGFAIGEFAFSRPFQRQSKGWVFQFNLAPGF